MVFSTSGINDCHKHPELKRKLYSALAECDEGELAISLPSSVCAKLSGASAGVVVSEGTIKGEYLSKNLS